MTALSSRPRQPRRPMEIAEDGPVGVVPKVHVLESDCASESPKVERSASGLSCIECETWTWI